METKKVGDTFEVNGIVIKIAVISKFGSTPHYGFFFAVDGKMEQGWIPCGLVDRFQNHTS